MEPTRMATAEELVSLKIQATSLIDCPVYKDDLEKIKSKKPKDFENVLAEQINRFMNYRKIEAGEIHKATGIPHSSLSEWINRKVEVQMLDDNIKKLARYFDCSIDYLAFGSPVSDRDIELDDIMPTLDEKFEIDRKEY